jgi:hypothetical protein
MLQIQQIKENKEATIAGLKKSILKMLKKPLNKSSRWMISVAKPKMS